MSHIIDLTNDSDGERNWDKLDAYYASLESSSASELIEVGGYRVGYEHGSVMNLRSVVLTLCSVFTWSFYFGFVAYLLGMKMYVDSVEDSITSEESNLDDDTGLLSIDDTGNDLASYPGYKSPQHKVKKQK